MYNIIDEYRFRENVARGSWIFKYIIVGKNIPSKKKKNLNPVTLSIICGISIKMFHFVFFYLYCSLEHIEGLNIFI